MSLNWNELREPFKKNINDLPSLTNVQKRNFKNRINNTFNRNQMKKIVNEAKNVKNNGRRTIAQTNKAAVNLGRQNGLSNATSQKVVNLAQQAASETKKQLVAGNVADAMVGAVVLLAGIIEILGKRPVNINANRVLNVFPRGLPHMEPWLSATYTPERWAKRAVFWFAQLKTKQFSPMYSLYEEAFATFGKNRKSKIGEYMTSLFIYSYYTFLVTMMPKFPASLRRFIKGTLVGLYQRVGHRYTLSVVTPILFAFMYNVYVEKLKLEASVSYRIYETLVGSFVEERAMQALATGGALVAKKALPYFAKLKVRQLAPPQYAQALEIAVDTVAAAANQRVRIEEVSPGGTRRPLTPGGGVRRTGMTPLRRITQNAPSPARSTRGRASTPNVAAGFETPPASPSRRR